MTLTSAPEAIASEAAVCRSACGVRPSRPTAADASSNTARWKVRDHVHGRPERYHFGIITCMAMTLRLTPEDEQLLTALAQAEGVSRHEATLRAIREAASR